MAWDDDGTVVYGIQQDTGGGTDLGRGVIPSGVVLAELTSTEQRNVNGDDDSFFGDDYGAVKSALNMVYLFFPEKREVDGYYWNILTGMVGGDVKFEYLSYSTDTTNGVDGSFSALGQEIRATAVVKPDYRDNIQTDALSNVTCVMEEFGGYTGVFGDQIKLRALHIYGTITPGDTPDRLLFLDTDNSDIEFTRPLDYGNVGRGSTNIRLVKVKNNSSTLTANTVQITAEALVDGSSAFTYSTDGVNDQGTKALGNIGPGGTANLYIHFALTDSFVLGLYEARTKASVASWS
jgi:hypothetical protein